MKNLKLLLAGLVLLFSCSKEDEIVVDPNLITGTWRLEKVTFNDTDGAEVNDWISNGFLYINDDRSYYRNYVGGEWTMNSRILVLDPGGSMPEFYWEYEVLELNIEKLKVHISLTEEQYCCDFDQFEENEVLTITEAYIKSE